MATSIAMPQRKVKAGRLPRSDHDTHRPTAPAGALGRAQENTIMDKRARKSAGATSRRSFIRKGLAVGGAATFGAATFGAGVLSQRLPALAHADSGGLTPGDAAILRFLAAAEILETDLWQQYNELGGIQDSEVPGGTGIAAYVTALQVLDMDMPQYIHDNTEDEMSHFTFINAFLKAHGVDPVNLDEFRTLQGSTAPGVNPDKIGKRLTNLLELTVDTSFWTRYRSSTGNPDLGDTFAPAVPDLLKGQFPAIPRDKNDLEGSTDTQPSTHLQAIANTAGFHFAFIEQGGSSLYPSLAQRVTHPDVLRILLSIGPTETSHFQTWHDKAGNAPQLTDPTNGLEFPNLAASTDPSLEANLIMPEPTVFLRGFPVVSIIRPTDTDHAAMGAVKALTDDGLFRGQVPAFFALLNELADAADAARRGV
jgi:hypothetical protein